MQKYTKFDFDWSSAPNPTGEAYSTPPDCIKATEVKKGKRNRREGKRRRRRGKEKRGRGEVTYLCIGVCNLAVLFILQCDNSSKLFINPAIFAKYNEICQKYA